MFGMWTVLGFALKTSLLIFVIGMISAVLTKKSAAYRHFLWISALTLALLMPCAVLYLPSFAVIPVSWQMSEPSVPGPSSIIAGPPIVLAETEDKGFIADSLTKAVWPMILIIWFAGALGLLMRDVLANVGLIRWVRRAQPLGSVRWAATLGRVSNELGLSRPLRVLESPHVVGPCTWGFVQPVLLLPVAGADWPESQRRHALLHELAHIRRFDYLSALVSRLACAMHWYNPLVWFAAAQARELQEQACDDAVLRAGGTPSDYAQFLLNIAEESNCAPGPFRIAMGMIRRSLLHGRVLAILDPHQARVQPDRFAVLVAFVPLSCLMLLLAAAATAPDARHKEQSVHSHAPVDARLADSREETTTLQPAEASTDPLPASEASPKRPAERDRADTHAPLHPNYEPPPREPVEPLLPVQPVEPLPPVEPVQPVPPVPPVGSLPPVPPVGPLPRADPSEVPAPAGPPSAPSVL